MGMSTKEVIALLGTIGGVIVVAGLVAGVGPLSVADSDDKNSNLKPMGDATADLRVIADDADTVYMAAPDAQVADEYGDYTETASTIESETEGDVYTVDITNGEGTISASNVGPNQDFKPGETYTVWSDGTGANVEFDEVTIPAETEAFKIENEISEEVVVNTLGTPVDGDLTQEITALDGDYAGQTTISDNGNPGVSTIYEDGEFRFYAEQEVDEGTQVLGEVSNVAVDSAVNNIELTVTADGEQVFSESASGSDAADIEDDLQEDIATNPVFADNSVEMEATVEFDDTETVSDTTAGFVNLTTKDLYGNNVFDVSITA